MCGIACGVTTGVLGTVLLLASTIIGYGLMDGIINSVIADTMSLQDDTVQMERFKEIPFPLTLAIRVFNITNKEDVLNGGVPFVYEVGPYYYKFYKARNILEYDEQTLDYELSERFEFDAEASYPCTEEDMLTVVNMPYNAILQVAELEFPELLAPLSLTLNGVFGDLNSPIVSVRARSLFLDGIPLCTNPGLAGRIACAQIRSVAESARNMALTPNGTLLFSIFGYRDGIPSPRYKVYRGIDDAKDLGRIITYDNSYRLRLWPEGDDGSIDEHSPNICNQINGTDSAVFPPFLNKDESLYVFNSDICRSVELRFERAYEYREVGVMSYTAKEWFLDNHQGCFCLNLTRGVTAPDGCLLRGTMELYSCVGALMVLSLPHFLYADPTYLNGVIGLTPNEDIHRIMMDIEPNTGVILRAEAKAQFNIFLRPVGQIAGTSNLRNVLTPLFWIEEGVELPEDMLDELKSRLLSTLRLVDILVPVIVAISCAILILGAGLTARAHIYKPTQQ